MEVNVAFNDYVQEQPSSFTLSNYCAKSFAIYHVVLPMRSGALVTYPGQHINKTL